jgi:hypothetical protein
MNQMVNGRGEEIMQGLQQWLGKRVTISYLPAKALFLSLHVLANPDHHTSRIGRVRESSRGFKLR